MGRLISKMSILVKAISESVKSLSKSQCFFFFAEIEKKKLEIHVESQRSPNSQNNREKEK